jgi:2-hydroxy-3-oxopropionate reductase
MSEVLLAHGQPLTVWNRTATKAESLREAGVVVARTPAEAAARITLTVLPDLADVRAVVDGPTGLRAGWLEAGIRSPLLVVMGTVSPVAVREYAGELAEDGIRLVDAPLSGGVIGAREARLSIMAGGSPSDVGELQPVFAIIGDIVRHMGPVGCGELAKACNQMIVASTVTAVSEAMILAREAGLDRAALLDILRGGLAGSEVLRQKGQNWVDESFKPGGTAAYQLKDLAFALDSASDAGVDLPLTTTVRDMFAALIGLGKGGLDHTGVFLELERRATLLSPVGELS